VIEAHNLTKRYGPTTAVDGLSFRVSPGKVTGFLGPNGAGKTTTMRMILGLDAPSTGAVTVNGRRYRDLPAPLSEVGALLDAKALHGGRGARRHLEVLAASNGLPRSRVEEVLRLVGLTEVARRKAGGFSLGMSQRLGVAAALLGDPGVLIFDEPVNGLDPEGILWIRQLMRSLAAEGRTVFVSSHLMGEMALTADHVLVIGRGRLVADAPMQDIVQGGPGGRVVVRSGDDTALAAALARGGAQVRSRSDGALEVAGVDAAAVGELAFAAGIVLHELTPERASLEEAFMELTRDSVDFAAEEVTP
jgi:ABC-2 type transport system ATP-binding protein